MADDLELRRADGTDGSNPGRRSVLVGLAVSGTLAGAFTLVVVTDPQLLLGFDETVSRLTRDWADSWGWPVDLAHQVALKTGVVWSSFVAGLFAVFLLLRRRWAASFFLMLSAFIGGLIGGCMKFLVSRDRPPGAERFEEDLTDSFPSGHTMVGIYLYLAAGLVMLRIGQANDRRWLVWLGWGFIVFGPLLGVTRLIVGAHWATDVIGGWAYGSAVVFGCALLFWEPLDRGWLTWRKRVERPTAP